MADFEYFTIKKIVCDPESGDRAIYIDLIEIDDGLLDDWAQANGYIKGENTPEQKVDMSSLEEKFTFQDGYWY